MAVANEDLTTKSIGITFKAVKIGVGVILEAMKLFLKGVDHQQHTGKQSLKALAQSGQALKSLDFIDGPNSDFNLAAFKKEAKKLKLDFTLVKNSEANKLSPGEPNQYTIFFKGRDTAQIYHGMKQMVKEPFLDNQKPSVKQELSHAKQKSAALAAERQSEKGMERTKDRGVIDR